MRYADVTFRQRRPYLFDTLGMTAPRRHPQQVT